METLSQFTDDQLADRIVTWAGRVAAGEAQLLELIGEYDRREAWGGHGMLSCAQWLSWRTSLSPTAAREKVRVARALHELPVVQQAFGAGRLSYSQVRAITRVATPHEQQRWVELARHTTAGQLDKAVRGVRRVHKIEQDAADPELAAWRMQARKSYDGDGNAVYRIVLPAEQAAVLDAALEAIRAELDSHGGAAAGASAEASCPQEQAAASTDKDRDRDGDGDASAEARCPQPAPMTEPTKATLADAFLAMSRAALAQQAGRSPSAARRTRAALVAQVDPLSGWGRLRDGELLPPTSLAAVRKTLPGRGGTVRLRPLTAADLRLHDLGRTSRLPSLALREHLARIDGERCRFPGCTRVRTLHAHHVTYWSAGGATDLANMVLLCSRHHTLVHQHGFFFVLHPDRRLSVATAAGVAVLHHPALPWRPAHELDPQRRICPDTLPPDAVEPRMDLDYIVTVLMQQSA
jgi:hypothetical protein